uniref:Uncharacterized protein n=1 Tax=Utricularia reniformis TaxID=192314 RepID=A0A1Y0B3A5_9LAMI|nr:hypothetical protein AEK19_MT1749 [Utricularia reniformis]ART31925.1 hypothetical protein AEK19_MT1749 [Utricularia reniformis]
MICVRFNSFSLYLSMRGQDKRTNLSFLVLLCGSHLLSRAKTSYTAGSKNPF